MFNHITPKVCSLTLISSLDKSANEERHYQIKELLNSLGYQPLIIDTFSLFQHMIRLPYFVTDPLSFSKYFFALLKFKLHQSPYPIFEEMLLRASVISKLIPKSTKVAIFQNPQDMAAILKTPDSIFTVYDSPTIFSEEMRLSGNLSPKNLSSLEKMENKVFAKSGAVCFHWYLFMELAKELKKPIAHPLTANWTCQKTQKLASFSSSPKVVYLGNINSPWINPKLLEKLQSTSDYPVDIYSYQTPSKSVYTKLNVKGFLEDTNQISTYQFGLITITNDYLRNSGFSAKYLLYLSHGLPVFCPEWRHDPLLSPATIYYNQKNFNSLLKKYQNPQLWEEKHRQAIKIARSLNPDSNFKDLKLLVNNAATEKTS